MPFFWGRVYQSHGWYGFLINYTNFPTDPMEKPSHTAARSSTKAVAPTAAACGWNLEQMCYVTYMYHILLHVIRHPGLVTGNPASWEGDMETPKEKRRFSSGLIPLASRTAVISLDRTSSRSRCSERLFSSHWA